MAVACICCGKLATEVVISVDVDTAEVHCGECDSTFDADDVRQHIAAWEALLPWLDAHPANRAAAKSEAADAAEAAGH